MQVIGLAGWSGAGKTTLLVRLIPELTRRGVSVSTLKHAHHGFDLDQPGKDSHAHRAAGAREVLVSSARRWALVHELRGEEEPALAPLLRRLSPVDLVLVEGFKASSHPKIEVYRAANGKPLMFPSQPEIRAIAADLPLPEAPIPVLSLGDVGAVADSVLALSRPLQEVLRGLEAAGPGPRQKFRAP